jgi:predicted nucleic acid-binding protein
LKTFLDSGVLLTAFDARQQDSVKALAMLDDARRELLTSDVVKLELLPKPVYFKQKNEVDFYESVFAASASCPLTPELFTHALELAKQCGLAAADALNMAAALRMGAAEFITTELPGKALFRVPGIRVVTLHAA